MREIDRERETETERERETERKRQRERERDRWTADSFLLETAQPHRSVQLQPVSVCVCVDACRRLSTLVLELKFVVYFIIYILFFVMRCFCVYILPP